MDLNSTILLAIAAAFLAEVIIYLSSSSVQRKTRPRLRPSEHPPVRGEKLSVIGQM